VKPIDWNKLRDRANNYYRLRTGGVALDSSAEGITCLFVAYDELTCERADADRRQQDVSIDDRVRAAMHALDSRPTLDIAPEDLEPQARAVLDAAPAPTIIEVDTQGPARELRDLLAEVHEVFIDCVGDLLDNQDLRERVRRAIGVES
jgi:hypothetical protein